MFAIFLLAGITICRSTLHSEFDSKQAVIPQRFSSEVEVLLLSDKKLIDATINFDGPGNRVAIQTLSEGAKFKTIINFNDDQIFEIDGISCKSSSISDENSFFPYDVDESTKKKTLKSAEDCFYLTNTKFFSEDLTSGLPLLIYNASTNVRQYQMAECLLTHRFTKPEVTASTCMVDTCNATLFDITAQCEDKGILHKYRFFKLQDTVDDTAFQVPPGIHCDVTGGENFPTLPTFFTFSYDYTEEWVTDDAAKDFEVYYKDLAFDSSYQLLLLNNYDSNGIASTKVFDFMEGVGYSITPAMKQCEVGPITKDMEPGAETMLPSLLFRSNSLDSKDKPSYIGIRKQLGLPFHVWTTLIKEGDFQVVKEIYFRKNLEGGKNHFLSHIVEYSYDVDENGGTEIDKITFTPIRKMKTTPRDLSIFNVTQCYEDIKAYKKFELKMKVICADDPNKQCPDDQHFARGTVIFDSMIENLYSKLSITSGLTPTRISNIQIISSTNKECIVRGFLLESPTVLNDEIPANKPEFKNSASKAFANIQADVDNGGFTFFFYSTDEKMDIRYTAISFEDTDSTQSTPDSTPSTTDSTPSTTNSTTRVTEMRGTYYSPGSMAALGIVMTLLGVIFGMIGLFVFLKTRNRRGRPVVNVT